MIIEAIKNYFEKGCPLLEGRRLNINCLGENPGSVSVDAVASGEVVKEYADGGALRQFVFTVSVRAPFDNDAAENESTAIFMEKLKDWICFKADASELVLSGGGAFPIEFEVLKTPSVSRRDRSGTEHIIRARLIYETV